MHGPPVPESQGGGTLKTCGKRNPYTGKIAGGHDFRQYVTTKDGSVYKRK